MEKNVILAALLSALLLAVYSEAVLKPQVRARQAQPTAGTTGSSATATTPPILQARASWVPALGEEPTHVLRGNLVHVTVGERSGAIRNVVMDGFEGPVAGQALEISHQFPLFAVDDAGAASSPWQVVRRESGLLELERVGTTGQEQLSYLVGDEERIVHVRYARTGELRAEKRGLIATWTRADSTAGNQNILELIALEDNQKHRKYRGPFKAPKDVPRGTLLTALSERYFSSCIRTDRAVQVRALPTQDSMIATSLTASGEEEFKADLYFGPRDYFYLKRAGFERAFPIGVLGQIGLILLALLGWIGGITNNYGIAVILFSIAVTCLTAPFTIVSFRSMKRMQALKPHMDKIMAQHKDDPKRANERVFALYKEHKVNPLGGCLPILLQMPIFFALIQAISHYVGLRGKPFLWIKDLSMPDRFAQLPFSLPFFGNELNMLPFVMAAAMYFQTKLSQKNMAGAESSPTANMMAGPLMPIIFTAMLYHFPAALVLYWITNSVMSMAWYRLAK